MGDNEIREKKKFLHRLHHKHERVLDHKAFVLFPNRLMNERLSQFSFHLKLPDEEEGRRRRRNLTWISIITLVYRSLVFWNVPCQVCNIQWLLSALGLDDMQELVQNRWCCLGILSVVCAEDFVPELVSPRFHRSKLASRS
jgi:hypothetical protein